MEQYANGGEGSSSKSKLSCVRSGDRLMFVVDLKAGETTFVSWKKLLKEASKVHGGSETATDRAAATDQRDILQSRNVFEGKVPEIEMDAPPANRFSAVIEKIERLYKGKDSSEDDELNDVPDDDQYDTGDSFIDDAELDEYFEVDKSAVKHDGFFVNRGKLERINEPTVVACQQPKKRRKKDLTKPFDQSDQISNKHSKPPKATSGKTGSSNGKCCKVGQEPQATKEHSNAKDKSAPVSLNTSHANIVNGFDGGTLASSAEIKEQEKAAVDSKSKNFGLDIAKETASSVPKRPASNVKHKVPSLEGAIRELEDTVAEVRPPTAEKPETDPAAQAVKRRLPLAIKLKLEKVARLAANSQGRVPKDLISRLMNILGHLMQLRTLKRNLKVMITTKQEKDKKIQSLKNEVVELIKSSWPPPELKEQSGGNHSFQEAIADKGDIKRRYRLDAVVEDKMCEIFDLFVEGLGDVSRPHVRKLYVELTELWPTGAMDSRGIKHAICRAKERQKSMKNKLLEQEKATGKKALAFKTSDMGCSAQPVQNTHRVMAVDRHDPVADLASNLPNPTVFATRMSHSPCPPRSELLQDNDREKEISAVLLKKGKWRPEQEPGTHCSSPGKPQVAQAFSEKSR